MERYGNRRRQKPPESETKKDRFELSWFQIQEILSFPSQKNGNFLPFEALTGIVDENEKQTLTLFAQSLNQPIQVPGNNILQALTTEANKTSNLEVKTILEKISQYANYYLITSNDLNNQDSFSRLPFEVQIAISTCGNGLFSKLIEFLNQGGVFTVLTFKKPLPNYLETINQEYPQLSPLEKIHQTIHQPSKNIIQASHQFININLIPQNPDDENQNKMKKHLQKIISHRVDEIEEKLAKFKLLESLLNEELKEVYISLIGSTLSIPLFYLLNHLGENSPLVQATIKILSHLSANLINAYAQFKLWLEGETNIEEIKDFMKKIANSPLFLSTIVASMGIDTISEIVGQTNPLLGSTIFGSEAVFGSLFTTLASSKQPNNRQKHSFLQELNENPAALAMNLSALGTMFASIGVLGLADQFHNPAAVALVGQATEPILAAIFTKLIVSHYSSEFKKKMKEKVNKWKEKNFN